MEIDRLWEKQFDYASDDVVAALRPRLIECLKAATARHPRNGHTYEALADLLAHQGDAAGSLAAYQEGAAQAESLPSRIRLLGEAGSTLYAAGTQAEKAEQWQAAADAYEKVAQTYPDLWCAQNALQRLVEVHGERLSDPQNALGAARRLEAQFPQDSDVPQTLSRAAAMLARADQAEPAVALTEELAAKYPSYRNLPDALIRAANIARKSLDQPDRALALLQKAIEAAGSRAEGAEARYDMARFLKAQGRQAEYDALAQEILRLYPYSSYAIALSTNPQQRESAQAAAKAFQQAYELVKADRNAEAVPALEAVVAQHPDTYHACVAQSVVATTYAKMQEPEKAVQAAQQFAERWPTHAEAPSNLYRAAAWMASPIGDVPRALAAYEAIVDQYPGDYYAELALYQTAQLRMQSSTALDYKESISCFERLLAEYSGSLYVGIAAKYIADCRMQLRDTEGARQGYLRIMAEAPNSYTAYLAARSFQTVRMRKEDAEQPAAR
jgi:tetratricopeptide (TPR) repeat protein